MRQIAMTGAAVACVLTLGTGVAAQVPKPSAKIDVVAVTGCLKESALDTWMLTAATDPVVSHANAPTPKELASASTRGTNEFRLIGVSEFKLAAHRDHTVLVKGLHIKATPLSRLNVTSVTTVAATCPPAPESLEGRESVHLSQVSRTAFKTLAPPEAGQNQYCPLARQSQSRAGFLARSEAEPR